MCPEGCSSSALSCFYILQQNDYSGPGLLCMDFCSHLQSCFVLFLMSIKAQIREWEGRGECEVQASPQGSRCPLLPSLVHSSRQTPAQDSPHLSGAGNGVLRKREHIEMHSEASGC